MDTRKPPAETSTRALVLANRQLLRAMDRERRLRKIYDAAVSDLRIARRNLALLVAAVSQP